MNRINILIFFTIISFHSNNCFSQNSNIKLSGDILEILLPATAIGSTFIYYNEDDKYAGTKQIIKSLALTTAITYALKFSINKKRPNGGNLGFPSGHTSSSFSAAAFLQKRYGWKTGIPAYVLASYVGWSRIYAKKHDIWDVLGGASIGIISSYIFTKPFIKDKGDLSIQQFENGFALNFSYKL